MTRLVIFDVDGTLVDSQAVILAAMNAAFDSQGLASPDRAAVLGIVGLSLDQAVWRLAPDHAPEVRARLVDGYKASYHAHRAQHGAAVGSPLFPGARELVETLANTPGTLLGVATGKSRRGLDALLSDHGLIHHFATLQVADDHPSKPHPSMILAALAETGCAPENAVMIGDTTYDMEMAAAAGVAGIGVHWGYHAPESLLPHARHMARDFDALTGLLAGQAA
ncbi:MAG: HAD-IA family hydrolase [Pseudooceanicola sp.]|nr:HAD-IA family hydrolase [Pseudooceanicola sp.]